MWYVSSLLHSTQQTVAKWCIHFMPEYSSPQKSCVDWNFTSRLQFSLISCNSVQFVCSICILRVSLLLGIYIQVILHLPSQKTQMQVGRCKVLSVVGRGEEKWGGMRKRGLEEQGINTPMCIGWVCLYFSRDFFNINVS